VNFYEIIKAIIKVCFPLTIISMIICAVVITAHVFIYSGLVYGCCALVLSSALLTMILIGIYLCLEEYEYF